MWKAWCQRLPPCEMSGPMPGSVTSMMASVRIASGCAAASANADRAAPVVADQMPARQAERARQQLPEVGGDGLLVVAVERPRAVAEPAQVGHDQPVVRREQRHDVPPLVPGRRPAVQQHHGVAGAGGDVVERDVAESRVMVFDVHRRAVISPEGCCRIRVSASGVLRLRRASRAARRAHPTLANRLPSTAHQGRTAGRCRADPP